MKKYPLTCIRVYGSVSGARLFVYRTGRGKDTLLIADMTKSTIERFRRVLSNMQPTTVELFSFGIAIYYYPMNKKAE